VSHFVDGPLAVRTARYERGRPAVSRDRARARVFEALALVDDATGLPPEALLVARRIRGVVSGTPALRVEGADLRAVARSAARARDGPLPRDADAVIFADDAELLAALAEDVTTGRPLPWWWTAVFGHGRPAGRSDRADLFATAIHSVLRAVPAAAARAPEAMLLAASRLTPAALLGLLEQVADAHAARQLAASARHLRIALLSPSLPVTSSPPMPASTQTVAGAAELPTAWVADAPPRPAVEPKHRSRSRPWSRWLDVGRGDAASPYAEAFVGSAAGLHLDPVTARATAYADAVAFELDRPATPLDRPATPLDRPATPSDQHPVSPAVAADGEISAQSTGERAEAAEIGLTSMPPGARSAALRGELTAWAGAAYLLPLLGELDLPASADGPGEPGPGLSRWGVLAVALQGLGADAEDPLFRVLAGLDGRHADAVAPSPRAKGAGDESVFSFRVQKWVRAWWPKPVTPWQWSVLDGRVVLVDRAIGSGLTIADVPFASADAETSAADIAAAEAAAAWPWDDRSPRCDRVDSLHRPDLAASLGAVHPTLRPWAAGAAGVLAALLERGGLSSTALQVPGRIDAGDLFVRFTISLELVDLRARSLGLDRNLGWVPALARAVELVFA
jgi:hypothetical protein